MGCVKGKAARGMLFLGIMLMLVPAATATAAGTATITGTVTDRGKPLVNITVDAYSIQSPSDPVSHRYLGRTDSNGTYSFSVIPGKYDVRFNDDDDQNANRNGVDNPLYVPRFLGDSQESAYHDHYHVAVDQTLTGNVELERAGMLRGIVKDPGGQGIADVDVAWTFCGWQVVCGGHTPLTIDTKTRGDGRYAIYGVSPSHCRKLTFSAPQDTGFAPLFFNTPDDIVVCPKEWETLTWDVTMQPDPAGDDPPTTGDNSPPTSTLVQAASIRPGGIAGRVRSSQGKALKKAVVLVYDSRGNTLKTTHTNKSGTYRVVGLAPGKYKLGFGAGGYRGKFLGSAQYETSHTVTVTSGHTSSGVNAKLKPNPR